MSSETRDWSKSENQEVEVTGTAENAKAARCRAKFFNMKWSPRSETWDRVYQRWEASQHEMLSLVIVERDHMFREIVRCQSLHSLDDKLTRQGRYCGLPVRLPRRCRVYGSIGSTGLIGWFLSGPTACLPLWSGTVTVTTEVLFA